jgi:hypothetical protein
VRVNIRMRQSWSLERKLVDSSMRTYCAHRFAATTRGIGREPARHRCRHGLHRDIPVARSSQLFELGERAGEDRGGDTYACENAVEPVQHMLLDRHRVIGQVTQVVIEILRKMELFTSEVDLEGRRSWAWCWWFVRLPCWTSCNRRNGVRTVHLPKIDPSRG